MQDSERKYVDLLFRVSKKYASWDPEIPVRVGDWGRITNGRTGLAFWRRGRGTFLKEGNIYDDGKAKLHKIPLPEEHGRGDAQAVSWFASANAQACDIGLAAGVPASTFAQCEVKAAFKFSSGYGAVLVMENDTISAIDPPGSLRRLLDDREMRDCVIVSEVHQCSSYARLLTSGTGEAIALGLKVSPPISDVGSINTEVAWVRNSNVGNFKSRVNRNGDRHFYPLFRLASLKEQAVSVGFRGGYDDGDPPLPDAIPPWFPENYENTEPTVPDTPPFEELPTDVVAGAFSFTVIRASGLARTALYSPKAYVTVQIGNQVHRTNLKVSRRAQTAVWDETFSFPQLGVKDVVINIYQTGLLQKDVLLGTITERLLDFQPSGTDVTKSMTDPKGGAVPVTITCRLGGTVFSGGTRCGIFAVIIGIDQYASRQIPDLEGCTNDAKSFKSFLVDSLHVPDSHIVLLMNETATRSAIISSFQAHLVNNNQIQDGDAIVIYYAGHGSQAAPPVQWMLRNAVVELLCPHDERMLVNGELVHGIPDRTINELLHELASAKGNNITVFIDSCHSGGLTRQLSPKAELRTRFVPTTEPIPADLDKDIWMSGVTRAASESVPAGFSHKFMESHVLLAACQQDQRAHESISDEGRPCGFFTHHLMKLLLTSPIHQITYAEVCDLLPVTVNQNPHCEGAHKNRILFSGRAAVGSRHVFALKEKGSGTFEVGAGSTNGVVVGTEFTLLESGTSFPSTESSRTLVAVAVRPSSSTLTLHPDHAEFVVPNPARVSVSNWKNDERVLKIFLESRSRERLAHNLFPNPEKQSPARNFVQVDRRPKAQLAIGLNDKAELVLERLDTLIPTFANRTAFFDATNHRLERLPDIFDDVAHFNFYLGKQHGSSALGGKVTMELYRLNGIPGFRVPDMQVGNLLAGNHAVIEVEEDVKYGVAIVSNCPHDLFPYLFYFDPSTYEIDAWYLPSTTTAPLSAQKGTGTAKVTVGYGSGSGFAFEFSLPAGESSDTGFLKLFVSTGPIDLEKIVQTSPWDGESTTRRGRMEILEPIWDAWVAAITVVERKRA